MDYRDELMELFQQLLPAQKKIAVLAVALSAAANVEGRAAQADIDSVEDCRWKEAGR